MSLIDPLWEERLYISSRCFNRLEGQWRILLFHGYHRVERVSPNCPTSLDSLVERAIRVDKHMEMHRRSRGFPESKTVPLPASSTYPPPHLNQWSLVVFIYLLLSVSATNPLCFLLRKLKHLFRWSRPISSNASALGEPFDPHYWIYSYIVL